jgi:hypothetical protein
MSQARLPQPPPRSQASHAMPTNRRTHGGAYGEDRRGAAARDKLRELNELRRKHEEVQEFLANKHKHQLLVEKSLRYGRRPYSYTYYVMVSETVSIYVWHLTTLCVVCGVGRVAVRVRRRRSS